MITTHFSYLTKLENTKKFKNYKIPIVRNDVNEIEYPYKLEYGASTQHIALELLKTKGFDQELVDNAISICNSLKESDVSNTDDGKNNIELKYDSNNEESSNDEEANDDEANDEEANVEDDNDEANGDDANDKANVEDDNDEANGDDDSNFENKDGKK